MSEGSTTAREKTYAVARMQCLVPLTLCVGCTLLEQELAQLVRYDVGRLQRANEECKNVTLFSCSLLSAGVTPIDDTFPR